MERFAEITKENEPLGPYTHLRLGGPAEYFVQPRSREELSAVLAHCTENEIGLRVLGGGGNILVREEGVRGAVIRLRAPAFTEIGVDGQRISAGAGASLSALISHAARHALAGLELLVGIPGTVGGAIRCNAGDRAGEIGQCVHRVDALDGRGEVVAHERDELRFAYRWCNIDEPVILRTEFDLEPDSPDAIVKRLRKAWIQRKASQPLTFQAAVRLFKDPRGLGAGTLIEQAGLARTRVGGAELSERDANFLVANPGASARDVLRLIDLVQSRVAEQFNVHLELQVSIW
jgi:UDP-N-acetylmuramate dehydrogenase